LSPILFSLQGAKTAIRALVLMPVKDVPSPAFYLFFR
jgi:hypothetical protein